MKPLWFILPAIVAVIAVLVGTYLLSPPDLLIPPLVRSSPRPRVTRPEAQKPLRRLPELLKIDAGLVALGKALFGERRLSTGRFACTTCHQAERGGADGQARSASLVKGEKTVNTPSIFNARFNDLFFWDGRSKTLHGAIRAVLEDKRYMGTNWSEATRALTEDRAYRAAFERLYPDGVTAKNIVSALSAYVGSLVTPSPFDRYLAGDKGAISADQEAGFWLFESYGCVACHQGVNVGGNLFQKFGLMSSFRGSPDLGRYRLTKRERDRYLLRVPSLRNVVLTGPYLYDGSLTDLETVVNAMAKHQLGRKLAKEEVRLIVEFLGSLSGRAPGAS